MPLGLVRSRGNGFSIGAGSTASGSDTFNQPDGTLLDSYGLWTNPPGIANQNKLTVNNNGGGVTGAGQPDVATDAAGVALWQGAGSTSRNATIQATFHSIADATALGLWIQNDTISSGYWAGFNSSVDITFYTIWKTTAGPTLTKLATSSHANTANDVIKFVLADNPSGGITLSFWLNGVLDLTVNIASPLSVGGPAIQIFQPGGNNVPNITNFSINANISTANQGNILYWLS